MKILSKLENTYIKGILIKKGINEIPEDVYKILSENKIFQKYLKFKHVEIFKNIQRALQTKAKKVEKELTAFENMSYNDLKNYVIQNKIETNSMKKDDLLQACLASVKE